MFKQNVALNLHAKIKLCLQFFFYFYEAHFFIFKYIFFIHTLKQIQLYGFNKELYHNMSEAQHKAQGIVGISLMVQIGDTLTSELRLITSALNKVVYKG